MLAARFIFVLSIAAFLAVLGFILLKLFRKMGTSSKEVDHAFRWSAQAKPTIGGLLFFSSFILFIIFKELDLGLKGHGYFWIVAGATLAFATGLWDDLSRISPKKKMLGQFLAALCLIASGSHLNVIPNETADMILTVMFAVGLMNSANMLDNMDGVSASMALCMVLYFLNVDREFLLGICLSGALIAFLIFNFYKSRMFMGDSGSLLLGFLLAYFLLEKTEASTTNFLARGVEILVLVASTLVDSLTVTINRLRHGISPAQGGRDHTTHNLVYLGIPAFAIPIVFIALGLLQLWIVLGLHEALEADSAMINYWVLTGVLYFLGLLLTMLAISWRNLRKGLFSYPAK